MREEATSTLPIDVKCGELDERSYIDVAVAEILDDDASASQQIRLRRSIEELTIERNRSKSLPIERNRR